MDINADMKLDCPNTEYVIESTSYVNGLLSLTVDFSKDMETLGCTFKIDFPANLVKNTGQIKLQFNVVSKNMPLLVNAL